MTKKLRSASPVFVVQQHAATHLHYDFRIEIEGVMKSWVLPKGPSLDPKTRRLAILTSNHSMAYNTFEGVIPQGEYGAGTVLLWDRGHYRNIKKKENGEPMTMAGSFRKGEIAIHLYGKKLKGGFALTRMRDQNWLFIKMKDAYAEPQTNLITSKPRSVKSGKTLVQLQTKSAHKKSI